MRRRGRGIRMVDVSGKPPTLRRAAAKAELQAGPAVVKAIRQGTVPKGEVIAAAQLAGIQAAKRTAEILPLCHPLQLSHVKVEVRLEGSKAVVVTEAVARESTGVEMEALTAAAVAALALYDMTKSLHRGMRITNLCLLEKSGGRSGPWARRR